MVEIVKKMVEIVEQYNLEELTIENSGTKIKLSCQKNNGIAVSVLETTERKPQPKPLPPTDSFQKISSPLTGIFHFSSEDTLKEGDILEAGKTLGFIESMKMMNELNIEKKYVLRKILVNNKQLVNRGDVLFLVENA